MKSYPEPPRLIGSWFRRCLGLALLAGAFACFGPAAFAQTSVSFEAENLAFTTSAGSTTSINADSGASNGSWVQLNATSVGEYIEFTTGSVAAGTYSVQLAYKSNTNRGQLAFAVDGATIGGPIDEYASAVSWPSPTVATVTFGSSGTHKLRLTVTGRNAASTGYLLSADKFSFVAQSTNTIAFEAENLPVATSSGSSTSVNADAAASAGNWVQLNATQTGEYMEFTTGTVAAGSYTLQLTYKANTSRGQLAFSVDGATVGPIVDEYASTVSWPTATIGTVTFAITGTHKLRLTVVGKNASSSAYLLSADKFNLAAAAPAAPASLTATAASTSEIDLSWTASAGATSYNVKRATTSGGPYTTIATVAATSYHDTTLAGATTYYYVVSALNSVGESADSAEASAVTAIAAFPAGQTVTSYLTGQNDWYNPPDTAWSTILNSGVTLVRIGGHTYDTTPPSDSWVLHQVDEIRSIGAEPIIQVSRFASLQTAVNTLTYINVTNARHVKFWSIGNEPDLGYSGTEDQLAAYVAGYIKTTAPALRDVDPTITIVAPDMAWYSTTKFTDLLGGNADITGTDTKGRYYVDYVTFHRYPFNSSNMTRSAILTEMHSGADNNVAALVTKVNSANSLHNRTGASALRWAMTEFNMTSGNDANNTISGWGASSFLNGQFFAEYYRVGMKRNAALMNTWSMLEGGGDGSTGDLGYLGGSWSAPVYRSSYYHLQMVADYLLPGGYLAATSSNANLAVVSTSSSTQSTVSVMLLNEDTADHTYSVRLNTGTVVGSGDTKINVPANLPVEYSGTITNQTTVVLIFDTFGHLKERVTYSLTNNLNNQAPQVEQF